MQVGLREFSHYTELTANYTTVTAAQKVESALRCTAPLNVWTTSFSWLTIHSAENSGVFEGSCPRESLRTTSLILYSEIFGCLPSRSW